MVKFFLFFLFFSGSCMEKDAIEQMKEPEFIILESRDTIVEDLTCADNGDIFGWATYRLKDQETLTDYIVTANYKEDSSKQY